MSKGASLTPVLVRLPSRFRQAAAGSSVLDLEVLLDLARQLLARGDAHLDRSGRAPIEDAELESMLLRGGDGACQVGRIVIGREHLAALVDLLRISRRLVGDA